MKNIKGSKEGGEPYHGFWTQDIYQLNSHFGTADDLKALSKAVHDRDMVCNLVKTDLNPAWANNEKLLMIDIVANNFAYAGPGQDTVFSNFVPFNDAKYFHPYCIIDDYDNT